jgi:hypothetical protein
MPNTVGDNIDKINAFLSEVSKEASYKEASENSQESHVGQSKSFKDTPAASPDTQSTAKAGQFKTTQTSLGNEQSAAAKAGGANIADINENSTSDGENFADTQGTQTLTTDEPVREKGNIGPITEQTITQEQKVARVQYLGSAILNVLKEANCGEASHSSNEEKYDDEIEVANGHDDLMKSAALDAGAHYAAQFYAGMQKRAEDLAAIEAAGINPALLQKVGGAEGLLDKVAMEYPEAVMPEGAMDMAMGGEMDAPAEGGGMDYPEEGGQDIEGMAAELEAAGVTPEELEAVLAEQGGGGGEGGSPDIEGIAAELEAAGVTAEELEAALADVQVLQEAGVAPEELAQALTEMNGEASPEMAEEPYTEEMKEAASRARIDSIKSYLR